MTEIETLLNGRQNITTRGSGKADMKRRSAVISTLLTIGLLGCAGGGPEGTNAPPPTPPPAPPPAGAPALQVLPTTFDFGKVTTGNTPAPLEVTVRNTGNAALSVSSIALSSSSSAAFRLRLAEGSKPCGSATATVAAGDFCNFEVDFVPSGNAVFTASVQIASNDMATPAYSLPLLGASEAVASLSVRINQLDTSCPASNVATAYVSVTDQGGYPLLGLGTGNFSITESSPTVTFQPLNVSYVDVAYQRIALAAALDHSSSLTSQPVAFADMKKGFTDFFASLQATDEGQVVNFDTGIEVVQPFTTDKALLQAAVATPWDQGGTTRLYDAVHLAVDDTALKQAYRRAVIVATDGQDNGSTRTLAEVTANAVNKKVAIFTIGLGASINAAVLDQMATATGGLFYQANTSQNLATIYQQLKTILYQRQYVVTFNQLSRGQGTVSPLTIGVVSPTGITGTSNAVGITSCFN
jgi:VWFA-related protein